MRSIRDLKSHKTRLSMLGLIAGAVLISFSGVWIKVAHVTPNVSVVYRVFIGGIVLLASAHRQLPAEPCRSQKSQSVPPCRFPR